MVTHAGWQTVNAALADGVPLVCIPDARDQPDNAARVLSVNAGVRVSKKSSPSKLRSVIASALEDRSIKQGARAMADALARSDGATVMADALERLPVRHGVKVTAPHDQKRVPKHVPNSANMSHLSELAGLLAVHELQSLEQLVIVEVGDFLNGQVDEKRCELIRLDTPRRVALR